MAVLLVKRASEFSPNMEEKDAAILDAVKAELEISGHHTTTCSEKDLPRSFKGIDMILHMARSGTALDWLGKAEAEGIRVLNSAISLKNLSRRKLLSLSQGTGTSTAPFCLCERGDIPYPCWWKRDDRISQACDDVVLLHDEREWKAVEARGITDFIIEQHIKGDLIKFYSITGTDFFYWCHPTFSKFGKEVENGKVAGYKFCTEKLKKEADKLATAAGLTIYGGDAIVDCEGHFYIIDMNDWPSFSPCREEAARFISGLL